MCSSDLSEEEEAEADTDTGEAVVVAAEVDMVMEAAAVEEEVPAAAVTERAEEVEPPGLFTFVDTSDQGQAKGPAAAVVVVGEEEVVDTATATGDKTDSDQLTHAKPRFQSRTETTHLHFR